MKHLLSRLHILLVGMEFDLRMVTVLAKEWKDWQDELEGHVQVLIKQMSREVGVYSENLDFSRKTEEDDEYIYYHFFSDYGEVVAKFTKTKERKIQFSDIQHTLYEQPHLLV